MANSLREMRFENFVLCPKTAELRRGGSVIPIEPQVFDLIKYLAENVGRIVNRDELIEHIWSGKIVSEATISNRINGARSALGDDGKTQRIIQTVTKRGFRFLPPVSVEKSPNEGSGTQQDPHLDIRYISAPDGVSLAYSALGEGDVILKTSSFLTHLEHELHSPVWRHWVRELSAHARYIRYDQRGNGLSDWDVENISFEACVSDLEAVIDTLGLERVTLLGVSQGASLSIEYARRHPDRVRRLLLVGGYAAGWRKIGIKLFEQRREALLNLIKAGWGMNNPAFRQPYSSLFFPNGSEDLYDWFNELQRISATPENAWRIMNMLGDIDVRDALSELDVPVLVIHSLNDQIVPFAAGKMLAAKIRNAQLLPLESDNHLVLETEPAWTTLIEEIKRFLCLTGTNTDDHA